MNDEKKRHLLRVYRARRWSTSWKHDRSAPLTIAGRIVAAASGGVLAWVVGGAQLNPVRDLGIAAAAGLAAWELFLRPAWHFVRTAPEQDHLRMHDEIAEVARVAAESQHAIENKLATYRQSLDGVSRQVHDLTAERDQERAARETAETEAEKWKTYVAPLEARIAELQAEFEERRRRHEIRETLAKFMLNGDAIKRKCVQERGSDAAEEAATVWYNQVAVYLADALGRDYAARFKTTSLAGPPSYPAGYPAGKGELLTRLSARIAWLDALLKEFA